MRPVAARARRRMVVDSMLMVSRVLILRIWESNLCGKGQKEKGEGERIYDRMDRCHFARKKWAVMQTICILDGYSLKSIHEIQHLISPHSILS